MHDLHEIRNVFLGLARRARQERRMGVNARKAPRTGTSGARGQRREGASTSPPGAGDLQAPPSSRSNDPVAEPGRLAWLSRAAALLVVAAALFAPAVYNGYPLVFSDTASYLWSAFEGTVPVDRPIGYGIFLRITGWRWSLWPSVAVQCAVSAVVLWLVLASYRLPRLVPWFVGIGIALTIATPLPWFAAQAMPDFLTPVAILSAFVLLTRWKSSTWLARLLAAAVLVLACVSHNSNLLLTGAFTGFAFLWCVLRRDAGGLGARLSAALRTAARTAAPLAAACALTLAMNYRQTGGQLFLTRGGHVFMVARLIESRVLPRLLDDRCGTTNYLLCPYRGRLTDSLELFMFHPSSPISEVGGIEGMPKPASMRMVRDAIRYYPAAVVGSSLHNSLRQFFLFYTGDGLRIYAMSSSRFRHVPLAVRAVFPAEYPRFAASRQQRGALPIGLVRPLHAVVSWAAIVGSAAVLVAAARARRRGNAPASSRAADLHAFVWLGTAMNAAICGSLSTVTDRFQGRVVWLFPFACLVTLALHLAARRRELADRA